MPPLSNLSRTSPTKCRLAPQPLGPLRIALLAIWAVASFGTCYFARSLQFGDAGRGLAYEWAGQGVLIVFIVLVAVNAMVFNRGPQPEDSAPDADHPGG